MTNTVLIKRSGVANSVPAAGNLSLGELALNYADGNLFYKNSSGSVTVIASNKFASVTGNVNANNVIATTIVNAASHTGNIVSITGNITAAGAVFGSGNVSTTGNIAANNVIATTISNAASFTGGLVSVTGNISGGNISTAGNVNGANIVATTLSATGNVVANNVVATTIVNAASHTGTLVSVTGNVTANNGMFTTIVNTASFTGTIVSVTGNATAGNVNTNRVVGTALALSSTGNLNLNPAGGNVVLSANTYINNLAYPAQNADAATKEYVDNFASTAISYHQPVYAATITTLEVATSGTITYAQPNGAGNGVGATLTTTGTYNLIDTANIQTVGRRVLVQNQANAVQNGIYTYANTTAIVRSTDADEYGSDSTTALSINDYFFVSSGNVNAGAAFIVSAPTGTITFGTSNITFSQFSSSQVYTANTAAGLTLVGTVFSTKVDSTTTAFDAGGNIIVKASANLTTPNIGAATGTSLSVTGNISATGGTFGSGNISTTGNIQGGNFVGAVAATTVSASGNVTANNGMFTNVVNVASHTGTIVSVTGNITGGNLNTTGTLSTSGNIAANNVIATTISNAASFTGGVVTVTGNIQTSGGFIRSASYLWASGSGSGASNAGVILDYSGNVQWQIYPETSSGRLAIYSGGSEWLSLSKTGFLSVVSNIQGGNLSAVGNVTANNGMFTTIVNVASHTGAVVSVTGNITGGNLSTSGSGGNITGANVISSTTLSATGNVVANNVIATTIVSAASHTGTLVSVTGNVNGGNLISAALVQGATVSSSGNVIAVGVAASGNISATANVQGGNGVFTTIVSAASHTGTIVSVTGNITAAGAVFGAGNVSTTGNIAAGFFIGNGSALTGVTAGAPTSIVNGTTNFTLAASGNANLTIAGTSNVVQWATTGQYVTGLVSVSGNVNGGNGVFTTIVSAASHTGTIVSVTGNVNGGNLISAALVQGATVSSSGNVVTVGVAASGNISATANVQGGNGVFTTIVSAASHTGTIVSVTGNVTGGNLATAGNVAVGAATAAYRLVVTGAANTIAAQVLPQGALPDNNDNAGLYVVHQGTAGTAFRARTDNALTGTIFAHVLVNNTSASINGFQVSQYGTGYIADFNKSGTALNSVRIDNNGNLGVGTTSVSYRLTLKQSTGDLQLAMQGTAKNWNFRNQADGTFGYFDDSLGYWRYYYDTSNNHIWFNSTSTERMRIDSGGTLSVVGAVSAGGNITGGNIAATSHTGSVVSITGNVTAAGATFGSGNVSTTGNIAAGFFVGNGSALTGIAASTPTSVVNGTTNFTLAPSGNANLTIAGTSNVAVFTTTGASFTGNITSNVANAYISKGLLLNATVVNVSYTLETGYNGQWVGPITINTGVVVTVPDGQRLLIA